MRGIRVGMIRMRGIRVGDDGNVWNQGGNDKNKGNQGGGWWECVESGWECGNQGENLLIGVEVMNKKFGEGWKQKEMWAFIKISKN